MSEPLTFRLERCLATMREAEARARVAYFRGGAWPDAIGERHDRDFVLGTGALDALAEAEASRSLDALRLGALRPHVAELRAEEVLSPTRRAWAELPKREFVVGDDSAPFAHRVATTAGRTAADHTERVESERLVQSVADEVAPRIWERSLSALAAGRQVEPKYGRVEEPQLAAARAVLERTRDLAEETLARLPLRGDAPLEWSTLISAIASREIESSNPPRDRARRVAAPFVELGFGREMNAIRREPARDAIGANASLALLDPGRDVRLAASARELGMISEMALAEGVGRGLAMNLTSAGHAFLIRHDIGSPVARAMGGIAAQLTIDRVSLSLRRIPSREAAVLRERGAAALLLSLRAMAARVLVMGEAPECGDEEASARAEHALLFRLPPGLARLLLMPGASAGTRFSGLWASLSAWPHLRDRLDEDWFANPRANEALRAACSRGGSEGLEPFRDALEIGDGDRQLDAGLARLWELVSG